MSRARRIRQRPDQRLHDNAAIRFAQPAQYRRGDALTQGSRRQHRMARPGYPALIVTGVLYVVA